MIKSLIFKCVGLVVKINVKSQNSKNVLQRDEIKITDIPSELLAMKRLRTGSTGLKKNTKVRKIYLTKKVAFLMCQFLCHSG